MSESKSTSPLLEALREQITPPVRKFGMDNIVVARSTLREMRKVGDELPQGASLIPHSLKSERTSVKTKYRRRQERSEITARWVKDGLQASTSPVLMFVIGGKVAIPFGDYILRCKPGQGAIILPETPRPDGSLLCIDDSDGETDFCDMLSFKTIGSGIWGWTSSSNGDRHWGSGIIPGGGCYIPLLRARTYLETLAQEAENRPPHFYEICNGLLRAFIALVLREVEAQRTYQPTTLHSTQTSNFFSFSQNDSVAQIEEYVSNHMHENLSIDRIAAYLYMSRTSFTHHFRKATGKSFNEYLTERRVEAAKVLLESTEWSINKVSSLVGITAARLRVLFRQREGCSPSEFRKKITAKP